MIRVFYRRGKCFMALVLAFFLLTVVMFPKAVYAAGPAIEVYGAGGGGGGGGSAALQMLFPGVGGNGGNGGSAAVNGFAGGQGHRSGNALVGGHGGGGGGTSGQAPGGDATSSIVGASGGGDAEPGFNGTTSAPTGAKGGKGATGTASTLTSSDPDPISISIIAGSGGGGGTGGKGGNSMGTLGHGGDGGNGGVGGIASLTLTAGNVSTGSIIVQSGAKGVNGATPAQGGDEPSGNGGIGGAGGAAGLQFAGTLTADSVTATKPTNGSAVTVNIGTLDVPALQSTILTSDGLGTGDTFMVAATNVSGGVLSSGTNNSDVLNLSAINFSAGNLDLTGGTKVGALNLTLPGALQAGGTAYPSPVTSVLLTNTTVSITNSGLLQLQPGESAVLLPGGVSGTPQNSTVTYNGNTYHLAISGGNLVISRAAALKSPSSLPQTGDSFPLGWMIAGLAVMAAGALAVSARLGGTRKIDGEKGAAEHQPK